MDKRFARHASGPRAPELLGVDIMRLFVSLLLIVGVFSCGLLTADDVEQNRSLKDEATPVFLLSGSCDLSCGGQSYNGDCYCDDKCGQFGDCCRDKYKFCGGELRGSCRQACGTISLRGNCWCDDKCEEAGDCCADLADECLCEMTDCTGVECGPVPKCNDLCGTCSSGEECQDGFCAEPGTTACWHDGDCGDGEYCDILATGTCQPGCGSDDDCEEAEAYCQFDFQCDLTPTTPPGGVCGEHEDCAAHTICTATDIETLLSCAGGIPIPGVPCMKTCQQVCDLVANEATNTCSAGETCGGDGMEALVEQIFAFQGFSDVAPRASVCLPPTE